MANEFDTFGYAARDTSGHLAPFQFNRRKIGIYDVEFEIKFCGICHTDLHEIKDEWKNSKFPVVPGHEIVGIVTKLGSGVEKFAIGDRVGVGYTFNSCRACQPCNAGLEQYCSKVVYVFNSTDHDGAPTYGGYSNRMVCGESYVVRIPEEIQLDLAAPLLCAGVTVYSPMVHFKLNEPGKTLGVVGLGGLGHMSVKFGKAFGLKVVVLSTSAHKKKEAIDILGADEFVVTSDEEQFNAAKGTLDYILDTVSAPHDVANYVNLLALDGKYIIVGLPYEPFCIQAGNLVFGRKLLAGSLVGGIQETQDMLNFCAKHKVVPLIEKISMEYVNTAMERLSKGDVRYRFVIDMGTLK